jgi:acetylornithine/succinyldiaminopimelate/putrescine aminotransferase
VIDKENLVEHAAKMGERATARIRASGKVADKIAEVRGRGLFMGIELKSDPIDLIPKSLEAGLVINLTSKRVIRLAPPINISQSLWDEGVDRVIEVIARL